MPVVYLGITAGLVVLGVVGRCSMSKRRFS
jgi:hypothetical protein